MYYKTYKENTQVCTVSFCFAETFFFFEKNYVCHPNLLKSVQNSNMWKQKLTRNSLFKIP